MDSARQVIRWAIPGWLMICFVSLFISIRNLLVEGSLTKAMERIQITPASVAVLAGISIPLGYVIFQLYYFFYLRFFPFRFVSVDRGWLVLSSIPNINSYLKRKGGCIFIQPFKYRRVWPDVDKLKSKTPKSKFLKILIMILRLFWDPLRAKSRNRKNVLELEPTMRNIARIYREHWQLAQIVWFESLKEHLSTKEYLQQDLRTTFDIFHSIGASRWALEIALTFYLVYELTIHGGKTILTTPEYLIALFINIFIFLVVFITFQHTRGEALLRGTNLMIYTIKFSGIIKQTKTTTASGSKRGIP